MAGSCMAVWQLFGPGHRAAAPLPTGLCRQGRERGVPPTPRPLPTGARGWGGVRLEVVALQVLVDTLVVRLVVAVAR